MLPKTEEEARKIAQSTILISFLLFLPITVVANTAGHETLTYLGLYEVALFATLIPLHSLFTVWIQVNQQLLYRNRKFGLSARLSIVHELILNLSKSALGLISPTATILLGSQITSSFLYVALTTKKEFLKGGRLKIQEKSSSRIVLPCCPNTKTSHYIVLQKLLSVPQLLACLWYF